MTASLGDYLDPWQLESLRQTQVAGFPDRSNIHRLVRASDGMGGWTTADPDSSQVSAGNPCSITPGAQLQTGGQADRGLELENWTITFPWETDVQDGDVVEWVKEGKQFTIINAKTSRTRGTAVRCTAEIVKGAPW